jgi:sulfatase modifying factor 1
MKFSGWTGDFDEKPVHRVKISNSFAIATRAVTNCEFERFDPDHRKWRGVSSVSKHDDDPAVFVSWDDAVRYYRWLSKESGTVCRLPTEAEWEFARRSAPAVFEKDGAILENWCHDWYGPYNSEEESDPVGRGSGSFKVTRGGPYKAEGNLPSVTNRIGNVASDRNRIVGFRIVKAVLPDTPPLSESPPRRWQRDVSQGEHEWKSTIPDDQPWFAEPIPFVKIPKELDGGPLYLDHNHCPGIAWCENGDLLAVWYTTKKEWGREHAIAASRLRRGRGEWDHADLFWDAPDRNDHTSTIWGDGSGTLYHFNGLAVDGGWKELALLMRTSRDHGVTWTAPRIIEPNHGYGNMPISSTFRREDGAVCLPCDAVPGGHGGSVLHISQDNGKTWSRPAAGKPASTFAAGKIGAWIAGIHTGIDQWIDGSIVAVGRGDSIDDKMPMSTSRDGGVTWSYCATPFPPIGGGQRAVLRTLSEKALMLVSFTPGSKFATAQGVEFEGKGMFVALSQDGGNSWPVRKLLTDGRHRVLDGHAWTDKFTMAATLAEPKGYLAATQTPDGIIHLISSGIHYRFNLAWIRTPNVIR